MPVKGTNVPSKIYAQKIISELDARDKKPNNKEIDAESWNKFVANIDSPNNNSCENSIGELISGSISTKDAEKKLATYINRIATSRNKVDKNVTTETLGQKWLKNLDTVFKIDSNYYTNKITDYMNANDSNPKDNYIDYKDWNAFMENIIGVKFNDTNKNKISIDDAKKQILHEINLASKNNNNKSWLEIAKSWYCNLQNLGNKLKENNSKNNKVQNTQDTVPIKKQSKEEQQAVQNTQNTEPTKKQKKREQKAVQNAQSTALTKKQKKREQKAVQNAQSTALTKKQKKREQKAVQNAQSTALTKKQKKREQKAVQNTQNTAPTKKQSKQEQQAVQNTQCKSLSINNFNIADQQYLAYTRPVAMDLVKNDKRLENLKIIDKKYKNWFLDENQFITDMPYATKNTGQVLDYIAEKMNIIFRVTSALATKGIFIKEKNKVVLKKSPHSTGRTPSAKLATHGNANNVKIDIVINNPKSSNKRDLYEEHRKLAGRLRASGLFSKADAESKEIHVDLQIKPEVFIALEMGYDMNTICMHSKKGNLKKLIEASI